jgi:hypothetical protein
MPRGDLQERDSRAVILPIWYIVLNSYPHACFIPKFSRPDVSDSPSVLRSAPILCGSDLAARSNDNIAVRVNYSGLIRRGVLRSRSRASETADLMGLFVLKYCVLFTFTSVRSGQSKCGGRNTHLCVVRTPYL